MQGLTSFFLAVGLCLRTFTDKKENQIFLIYKEIRNGAVAKSYMSNCLLIYDYSKYLRISSYILGSSSSYMTLQLLLSEFHYIWGKFSLFYQCIKLCLRWDVPRCGGEARSPGSLCWPRPGLPVCCREHPCPLAEDPARGQVIINPIF